MMSKKGYLTIFLSLLPALIIPFSVKSAGNSRLFTGFGGNTVAEVNQLGRADIEILPATPKVDDNIRIRISGRWSSSCVPVGPKLTIEGSTIRIGTNIGDFFCSQVVTPWEHIITVGKLEPRSYEVIVNANLLGTENIIGRKSFLVGFGDVPRADIEIIPFVPTVNDEIKIRISGSGSSSCSPRNPQLKIEGNEIQIATSNPGEICTADLRPWEHIVTVGKLKNGFYRAIATFTGPRSQGVMGSKDFLVGFGSVPQANIELLPAAPTANDEIKVKISGSWSSSCAPRDPRVSVRNNEVLIETFNPEAACTKDLRPWEHTVVVGKLARGTYRAVATFSGQSGEGVMGRKSFVVGFGIAPAANIEILPPVPTSDDNINIRISGSTSSS